VQPELASVGRASIGRWDECEDEHVSADVMWDWQTGARRRRGDHDEERYQIRGTPYTVAWMKHLDCVGEVFEQPVQARRSSPSAANSRVSDPSTSRCLRTVSSPVGFHPISNLRELPPDTADTHSIPVHGFRYIGLGNGRSPRFCECLRIISPQASGCICLARSEGFEPPTF
jgi:hypothetical protein